MTAKREPRQRFPKTSVTPEMIQLWEQGRALMAEGHDDVWGDHSEDDDPHWDFVRVDKRLNWTLLKRAPHEISVFNRGLGEAYDEAMPDYMQARCTIAHPDLYGWYSAQRMAKELEAAARCAVRMR
jgi:hypothetical protein